MRAQGVVRSDVKKGRNGRTKRGVEGHNGRNKRGVGHKGIEVQKVYKGL